MQDDDNSLNENGDGGEQQKNENNSVRARLAKKDQQTQEKLMQQQAEFEEKLAKESEARQQAEQKAAQALADKDKLMQEVQGKKFTEQDVYQAADLLADKKVKQQTEEQARNEMIGRVKEAASKDTELQTLLDKHPGLPPFQQYVMANDLKYMKELPGVLKHILKNPEQEALFNSFDPSDPSSKREMIKFMNSIRDEISPQPSGNNNKKNSYEPSPNLSGDSGDDDFDYMEYTRSKMG